MRSLENLKIWGKAINMVKQVYEVTEKFPAHERYGLMSQIRRCSVSVPSNIAEGAGRNSGKQFVHFLSIANGSCYELRTQLIIANKLEYIDLMQLDKLLILIDEIQRMNFSLQKSKSVTNDINLFNEEESEYEVSNSFFLTPNS